MTAIEVTDPPCHSVCRRPPVAQAGRCSAPGTIAPHFTTAPQQFDAAKLGMWLFLATEVLLFGGLFVVYAVLRSAHPEVFRYGSQFLDTRMGAINTIILILSSLTMALAVHAAQRGAWRMLVACLLGTTLGGVGFLSIKYVEYSHKIQEGLVLGPEFYSRPEWVAREMALAEWNSTHGVSGALGLGAGVGASGVGGGHESGAGAGVGEMADSPGDVSKGNTIWNATCRTCHGARGEGMPGSGKPLQGSVFVNGKSDVELVKFLKAGRPVTDPLNTTGGPMPPKGGNPLLKDSDLRDVLAFVRTLTGGEGPGEAPAQLLAGAGPAATTAEAGTAEAGTAAGARAATEPLKEPEPFWVPASSIPNAPPGPEGLAEGVTLPGANSWGVAETDPVYPHHSVDEALPTDAHQFFAIYYLMTGLHGIHVLVGTVVIAGLAVMSMRGRFGPRCYTAVDLGGLYWHLVDIIWIFLFPLFYLI